MMKKSVSVIIACLNEEENLDGTYANVVAALQGAIDDYEFSSSTTAAPTERAR